MFPIGKGIEVWKIFRIHLQIFLFLFYVIFFSSSPSGCVLFWSWQVSNWVLNSHDRKVLIGRICAHIGFRNSKAISSSREKIGTSDFVWLEASQIWSTHHFRWIWHGTMLFLLLLLQKMMLKPAFNHDHNSSENSLINGYHDWIQTERLRDF